MSGAARRPFWFALALSLLLHLGMLTAPGWSLPFEDETDAAALTATLVAPPPAPAIPKPAPRPRPKPRPRPAVPPPVPEPVVPDTLAMPAAEPEPAPAPVPDSDPAVEPPSTPEPVSAPAVPPALTFADVWPRRGRIVYQVTRGEDGFIVGRSEHAWRHDGANYELRALTETTGLAALFRPAQVVQESRGAIGVAGLRPGEFRSERDGKPKDAASFDPARPEAVQDMLSLFHHLGALPLETPEFTLTLMAGRRIADYRITVAAPARIELPDGARLARHLKIVAARGREGEDSTEVWLDVDSRLPLKIRHRDRKGEVYDQVVTQIELGKNIE
ncbi:MAG: DUF3108 domain-containing protein [Pseudomonadota bacterium]